MTRLPQENNTQSKAAMEAAHAKGGVHKVAGVGHDPNFKIKVQDKTQTT